MLSVQKFLLCGLASLIFWLCTLFTIGLVSGCSSPISYPEINDTTTIDDIAKPYIESRSDVGLVIGIYRKKESRILCYGVKDRQTNVKPDGNTLFEIGSITKTFTAALAQKLNDEGVINLRAPVQTYLPKDVKMPKYGDNPVTLFHLANHTSALPRMPDNFRNQVNESDPFAHYTKQLSYEFLSHYQLKRKAGEVPEYSNFGMGLLGLVLSEETGTSYQELIKNKLFDPLNMERTTITITPELAANVARGHNVHGEETPYWHFTEAFVGAGGLKSTANDMILYIKANLYPAYSSLGDTLSGTHRPTAVVDKTRNRKIGLSWNIWPYGKSHEKRLYLHNGRTGGFSSFVGFSKDDELGVVVLSNSANKVDPMAYLILNLLIRS